MQLHQYTPGRIETDGVALETTTGYPFDGRIAVRVAQTPAEGWELAPRVPAWAEGATATLNGTAITVVPGEYLRIKRAWRTGDGVELDLPTAPRLVAPNPRIDDVRGSVAAMRGPLVYTVEQVDQQAAVDDLAVDPAVPLREMREEHRLGGVPSVVLAGRVRDGAAYRSVPAASEAIRAVDVATVPYFMGPTARVGPMRVWIPIAN